MITCVRSNYFEVAKGLMIFIPMIVLIVAQQCNV